MKLKSVTFPKDAAAFRCGGDQDHTWIADRRNCEIWIDGHFVYVRHQGAVAFAHVSRIAHALLADDDKPALKKAKEATA
jgi:hypothetical protein